MLFSSFTDGSADSFLGGLRAQSVSQADQVTVAEGDPATVECNYSVSGSPYLFWYVQHRNQGLQFLLKYITGDNLVKGYYGFEAELNKSQTSFHLKKSSILGSDSAVYFCAVTDTVVGASRGAEHKPLSATVKLFSQSLYYSLQKAVWFQDMSLIITKLQFQATEFVCWTNIYESLCAWYCTEH